MATSDFTTGSTAAHGHSRPALAEESFGQLVRELGEDVSTLVKQEITLARTELSAKAKEAGAGVGMLVGAGVIALAFLGALTAFLIIVLDTFMPLWLAALIVTIFWAVVALVLVQLGRARLRRATPPVPEQTIDTVKEDIQWAKHPTRSDRT